MLSLGSFSYSELPRDFQGLFGVSGSLSTLTASERSLLKNYDIELISYYPSFFGRQKVKFDPMNDFKTARQRERMDRFYYQELP